ncbi:hypothetical protein Goshw_002010 [Gossypium schwendimanii]|uniref:RNase H type-1 domain-containing protein n=1 Tax=Gossypium schwendimanii TaxID=34291 RepID=A0A7J9LDJ7_GOSSC|nr:hypothetical protein [Gossypium schwendimanii]
MEMSKSSEGLSLYLPGSQSQIAPIEEHRCFFFENLQEWLASNLQNHQNLAFEGIDWLVFFGLVTWCIWKNRNFLIFQRMPWSAKEIIKGSYSWGKQHVSFRKVNSIVRQVMRGKYNWIGECIIGLNRRLGKCSICDAELQGILDGLSILQGKQCDRVLMQIDSLEIIEVIHESNSRSFNLTLIRHIHQLLKNVEK